MHVKAADRELCPLLISSHSSCVPELHGQHLCDRAEHMATATTQVRHLDSTRAKRCPKELPKSPPNSSHPNTGMERGRTEITVQVLGVEPQKMANQLVLFKDRWTVPGNEGSRGTLSWGDSPVTPLCPPVVQLCTATSIPTGQTDSWQLPLPEISPEVLLLYHKCLIWLWNKKQCHSCFCIFQFEVICSVIDFKIYIVQSSKNVIFRHFGAQVLEKNKLKNVPDTKNIILRYNYFLCD